MRVIDPSRLSESPIRRRVPAGQYVLALRQSQSAADLLRPAERRAWERVAAPDGRVGSPPSLPLSLSPFPPSLPLYLPSLLSAG